MKVGDLVRTKFARIGTPQGTLGLVVENYDVDCGIKMFVVQILGNQGPSVLRWPQVKRRWLSVDLEMVNESR